MHRGQAALLKQSRDQNDHGKARKIQEAVGQKMETDIADSQHQLIFQHNRKNISFVLIWNDFIVNLSKFLYTFFGAINFYNNYFWFFSDYEKLINL